MQCILLWLEGTILLLFFQNCRGASPHQWEERPFPYPPHSALRASGPPSLFTLGLLLDPPLKARSLTSTAIPPPPPPLIKFNTLEAFPYNLLFYGLRQSDDIESFERHIQHLSDTENTYHKIFRASYYHRFLHLLSPFPNVCVGVTTVSAESFSFIF